MSIPSWMLCGEDGPSGGFALVTAHVKGAITQLINTGIVYIQTDKQRHNIGIYYAMKGEGAKAAGAGAGLWGSLSGGVIGFCFGGPVGAFVGSFFGGAAAGIGTEAIIEAFTPEQEAVRSQCCIEKRPMGINKQYLHRFRRRPAVRESIDHMFFRIKDVGGNQYMFWVYEGREIPVFAKPNDPNHLFAYHRVGRYDCESSWQLTSDGNLKERNLTLNEKWDWIRED